MTDPTEESRAAEEREQLLRRLDAERAFLEAVLRQLPLGVIIAEAPSGKLILANEQMEQIWRQPFRPAVDVGEYDQYPGFHLDGRPYRPEEWPLARSITTGEVVSGEEISIGRGDGTRGIIRVNSVPIRDRDGRITAGVVTFEDITERRRTQAAEHLLVEASTLLAASLDYEATLQAVARLALPALADLCVLDMADEEGALRRLAVAHTDPAKQALAAKLLAYPPEAGGSQPAPQAVRTGEPAIHPEISDELLARISRHPEHLEVLRALAPRSAMVVPLVARGRILGVITFLSAVSGHR
ncbi:MAG TPA: GAF domain-containing protein [Ardenticatenaceae bacterium]|nr:GAF domain-containing protein [Ardenticatenaceae bacterium]